MLHLHFPLLLHLLLPAAAAAIPVEEVHVILTGLCCSQQDLWQSARQSQQQRYRKLMMLDSERLVKTMCRCGLPWLPAAAITECLPQLLVAYMHLFRHDMPISGAICGLS